MKKPAKAECKYCKKIISKSNMSTHLKKCLVNELVKDPQLRNILERKKYKKECIYCGFSFDKRNFKVHLKNCKVIKLDKMKKSKDNYEKEEFVSAQDVVDLSIKIKENIIKCECCGKEFSTSKNIAFHKENSCKMFNMNNMDKEKVDFHRKEENKDIDVILKCENIKAEDKRITANIENLDEIIKTYISNKKINVLSKCENIKENDKKTKNIAELDEFIKNYVSKEIAERILLCQKKRIHLKKKKINLI